MRLPCCARGLSLLIMAVPVLAGGPFLLVGLYELYKTERQVRSYRTAQGVIVGNSYLTINDSGTESGAYHPVVEFMDERGEKVRFTDGIGSLPPDYEVGASVSVVYNPARSQEARIKSWKRLWLAPTLLCMIGLLPILIGLGLAWLVGRPSKRAGLNRYAAGAQP